MIPIGAHELQEDIDRALASAARQLVVIVAAMEAGRPTFDSLCAHHARGPRIQSLAVAGSGRSESYAAAALEGPDVGARIVSIVMHSTAADQRDGTRSDAFLVRLVKPGDPLLLEFLLPYRRSGREVVFRGDVCLIQSVLTPANCGRALFDGVRRAMTTGEGEIRARLPTRLDVEETDALGHAPLAILALVAGADGQVDRAELQAFSEALEVHIGPTRELEAAFVKVADPLAVARDVVCRSHNLNLLALGEAAVLLDERLGAEADAEKRALVALGEALAAVTNGEKARRGLAYATAALGLSPKPPPTPPLAGTSTVDALRALLATVPGDVAVLVEGDDGVSLDDPGVHPGFVAIDAARGERFVAFEDGPSPAVQFTRRDLLGWNPNPPMTVADLTAELADQPGHARVLLEGTDEDDRAAMANAAWDDDDDDETRVVVDVVVLLAPVRGGQIARDGDAVPAVVLARSLPDDADRLAERARAFLP